MNAPTIDESKLPKVMQILSDANVLMTEKDCESDSAVQQELETLQDRLRALTGNQKLQISSFKRYDAVSSLETAARGALMSPPEKEDITDGQIKEIVLNILQHDEVETDWWLGYLKLNTGLKNLTDYIFYPALVGLDRDSSMEQIADKIIADMHSA